MSLDEQLLAACKAGNSGAVASLLDQGADPGCSQAGGETCLMVAAGEGHGDCVALLLSTWESWSVRGGALPGRDGSV